MRKLIAGACCGVIAAIAAGSAGATPPPQAHSCVGPIVSSAAQLWNQDDSVQGGLGAEAHATNQNVGEAVQQASTLLCGKH